MIKVINRKIKHFLRRIVLRANKKLGITLQGEKNLFKKQNLLNNFIGILNHQNWKPNFIMDIGANHGTWTRIIKDSFPDAKFLMVEPQAWLKPSFEDLLDNKTTFLPAGAGKENGIMLFTINSERDDSSCFSMTALEADQKGFKQMEIPVWTINHILQDHGGQVPDIIKIDAEGLDIDVLHGASNTFGVTEIFLVEVSINALFQETSMLNVLRFMDNNGYRFFEITDINRPFSNNVLWLMEFVFVRKGGYFDNIKWYDEH